MTYSYDERMEKLGLILRMDEQGKKQDALKQFIEQEKELLAGMTPPSVRSQALTLATNTLRQYAAPPSVASPSVASPSVASPSVASPSVASPSPALRLDAAQISRLSFLSSSSLPLTPKYDTGNSCFFSS